MDQDRYSSLERKTAARQNEREQSSPKHKPARRKKRRWIYAFFAALALEIKQTKEKAAAQKAQRSAEAEKKKALQLEKTSHRVKREKPRIMLEADKPAEKAKQPERIPVPARPATEEDDFAYFLNYMSDETPEPESEDTQSAAVLDIQEAENEDFLNLAMFDLPDAVPEEPASSEVFDTQEAENEDFLNLAMFDLPEAAPEDSASSGVYDAPEQETEVPLEVSSENTEADDFDSLLSSLLPFLEDTEVEASSDIEPDNEDMAAPAAAEPQPATPAELPSTEADNVTKVAPRRRKVDKKTWIVAVIIFCAIMLATLAFLGIRSATAANDFKKLSQQISEKEAELPATAPKEENPVIESGDEAEETNPEATEPVVKTILPKYADLVVQNPELFGWVRIEDTVLDYPVMRSTMDNEKYLYANFEGKYSFAGTPFADNKCSYDSDNLVIYGHNIKDGSMFRSLFKYEKEAYWKKHPTIMYSDLYEDYEYEVMAVFYDRIYKKTEDVFKFYQFIDAENEAEFDYAVSQLKSKSLYDTGVDAEYGDQLITLVTCAYHVQNGRFVVVARRK